MLEDITKMTQAEERQFMFQLKQEYSSAYNSITQDIADFVEKYGMDPNKLDPVKFRQYKRLESLKSQVGSTIDFLNKQGTTAKLTDYLTKIYEKNYYGAGYAIEKMGQINLSYSRLNKQAIARSILTDYDNVALKYNQAEVKRKLSMAMTQSIIRGESIDNMSKRIKWALEQNANKTARIARTTTTRVMGQARLDSFKKATDAGLDLQKTWVATSDSRTRTSHASIDGETVPMDSLFSIGVKYPGDPNGSPAQTINCRCTMITDIKKKYGTQPVQAKSLDEWIEGLVNPPTKPPQVSTPTLGDSWFTPFKTKAKVREEFTNLGVHDIPNSFENLPLPVLNNWVREVTRIYNEFPKMKGSIKQLITAPGAKNQNSYAYIRGWIEEVIPNGKWLDRKIYPSQEFMVNQNLFEKVADVEKTYLDDLKVKYHPEGTTWEQVTTHEMGHVIHNNMHYMRMGIDPVNDELVSFGKGAELSVEMFNNNTFIGDLMEEVKQKFPECNGDWKVLAADLSVYATKNEKEFFAESVADYYGNGENAKPYSKFMMERTKYWYNKYQENWDERRKDRAGDYLKV